MAAVIEVLQKRGFIDALTDEQLKEICLNPLKLYIGFDPTSDSLHLGNFIPIMGLAWFQKYGHTPIAIVGGATGMIGDPSGRSTERNLLDAEELQKNLNGIQKNLEGILDFNHPTAKAMILNNFDWFKKFGYLDFLRDIGKYFRIGPMLAKESVKSRLASEEGLSYTEFSYQLLQAFDFLHLYDHHGVVLQMGGSDQWGNITAGIDLIRRLRGKQTYGLTFPLLTRSDGKKFGKSEEGAIWLSSEKLSYYEFYQYLVRVPDADVIKMMRLMTFMDMEEIEDFENMMKNSCYIPNTAQKKLAEEVTKIVHGEKGLQIALRATEAASPGSETRLDAQMLEGIASDIPSVNLPATELLSKKIFEILTLVQLASSKGEARRLIKNGGVYLNNQKMSDENRELVMDDLIDKRMFLLAIGKKNKMLVLCSGIV